MHYIYSTFRCGLMSNDTWVHAPLVLKSSCVFVFIYCKPACVPAVSREQRLLVSVTKKFVDGQDRLMVRGNSIGTMLGEVDAAADGCSCRALLLSRLVSTSSWQPLVTVFNRVFCQQQQRSLNL